MRKSLARGLVVVVAAATGLLAVAAPASAHVTVNPREATQGSYARVAFRVPTESDTASTTKLEVHLPEEAPIASVSVMPVPGWDIEVTRETLDEPVEGGHGSTITEAVTLITWTAADEEVALAPGEFGEFPVSLGPLPEVDQLVFRSLQTYSDGTVVRWIDPPEEGAELEHPAPVLALLPAGSADADQAEPADEAPPAASGESESGGSAGVWLGLAGLVAGLGGLALGAVALRRTRRDVSAG